jgi:hypothetical protein
VRLGCGKERRKTREIEARFSLLSFELVDLLTQRRDGHNCFVEDCVLLRLALAVETEQRAQQVKQVLEVVAARALARVLPLLAGVGRGNEAASGEAGSNGGRGRTAATGE